jgi:hypothetical protein
VADWPDARDDLEIMAKRVMLTRLTNQNLVVVYSAVTSLAELQSCCLEALSSLMFILCPIAFKVCPTFSRERAYVCVLTEKKITSLTVLLAEVPVTVKQSHYRPGQAHSVPDGSGS